MLNTLLVFAVVVLILQVVLFFVIRARKKKMKEESVIEKYNIKTRADAWRLLGDPELDEVDRKRIQDLYDDKA